MPKELRFPRLNPVQFWVYQFQENITNSIFKTWENQKGKGCNIFTDSLDVRFQFLVPFEDLNERHSINIAIKDSEDKKIQDVNIVGNFNNKLSASTNGLSIVEVFRDLETNYITFEVVLKASAFKNINSDTINFEVTYTNISKSYSKYYKSDEYYIADSSDIFSNYPELGKFDFRSSENIVKKDFKFQNDKFNYIIFPYIYLDTISQDEESEEIDNILGEQEILTSTPLEVNTYFFNNVPHKVYDTITNILTLDEVIYNGRKIIRSKLPDAEHHGKGFVSFRLTLKTAEYDPSRDFGEFEAPLPDPCYFFKTNKEGTIDIDIASNNPNNKILWRDGYKNPIKMPWTRKSTDSDTIEVYFSANATQSDFNSIKFGDDDVLSCGASKNTDGFDFSYWTDLEELEFNNNTPSKFKLADNSFKKTGDIISVVNSFFDDTSLEMLLKEVKRVSDTGQGNVVARTLNIGTILNPALIDKGGAYYDEFEYLKTIGWNITVVSQKLLTASIGNSIQVDFNNRTTQTQGSELWLLNGHRVVGGVQLNNGDILELYHSDVDSVSYIDLSSTSLLNYDPSIILLASDIHLDLVNNDFLESERINELIQIIFDYLEDGTIKANGLKLNMINCFEDASVFNHALNGAVSEYGIDIIIPQAICISPYPWRNDQRIPRWRQEVAKDEDGNYLQNAYIGSKYELENGEYYGIRFQSNSDTTFHTKDNIQNTWYFYFGNNQRILNELRLNNKTSMNAHVRRSIARYTENNLPYDPNLVKLWGSTWSQYTQGAMNKIFESLNMETIDFSSNYDYSWMVDNQGNVLNALDCSKIANNVKKLHLGSNGGFYKLDTITGLSGKRLQKFNLGARTRGFSSLNQIDLSGCDELEYAYSVPRANVTGCISLKDFGIMPLAGQYFGYVGLEDCVQLERIVIYNSATLVNILRSEDYTDTFKINSQNITDIYLWINHNNDNQNIAFLNTFSPNLTRFAIKNTGFINGVQGLDFSVLSNSTQDVHITIKGCFVPTDDLTNYPYGIKDSEAQTIMDQLLSVTGNKGTITCKFDYNEYVASMRTISQALMDKINLLSQKNNFLVKTNYNVV